ncbi:hypothetical protein CEQ30_33995 [Nocardia brasiliensis]|nr:hypothetical protein CEQ30_33995 [Nocardia brasiliensis]
MGARRNRGRPACRSPRTCNARDERGLEHRHGGRAQRPHARSGRHLADRPLSAPQPRPHPPHRPPRLPPPHPHPPRRLPYHPGPLRNPREPSPELICRRQRPPPHPPRHRPSVRCLHLTQGPAISANRDRS